MWQDTVSENLAAFSRQQLELNKLAIQLHTILHPMLILKIIWQSYPELQITDISALIEPDLSQFIIWRHIIIQRKYNGY